MTVKTEGQHTGEFLAATPGSISFEKGTLASGQVTKDGDVPALSGGKLVRSTGNAGGEVIVGISYGAHDASAADKKGVPYIARLAEVKKGKVYVNASEDDASLDSDTVAELATNFIIFRDVA